MSSTATQAQEAHQPAAAEASHKRKREETEDDGDENVVERKFGLDRDILDCPICMKTFSRPVFQCQNSHTVCKACCKKLISKKCPSCTLPTGTIRCIAIEKLVESLSMGCKNARHGCEQMKRPNDIKDHERCCEYEPFCCPVPECNYKATRDPLLRHLTEVHDIPTVALNNHISGVNFRMGPLNRFVMVSVDVEKTHLIYLVRCEVLESLGDIFFCNYFGDLDIENFNLRVKRSRSSVPHIMKSAEPIHLRCLEKYLKRDFLVVPGAKPFREFNSESFKLNFKVNDDIDDDDDDGE